MSAAGGRRSLTRRPSSFGHTELPEEQQEALRKAERLAWWTIVFLVTAVVAVFLAMGSSQAMKAAWAEDMLSFIPPITFLVAVRVAGRRPSAKHPYGFHRSVGIGHLVAATSLVLMGAFMVWDSAAGLVAVRGAGRTERHPARVRAAWVGGVTLAGGAVVVLLTSLQ